ncbi:hypothetical protein, partial [Escherichia coli]|uniref:hypothetical protein n=1 Tax=Escherichia coli TaxID=562 RepID=UPI00202DFC86
WTTLPSHLLELTETEETTLGHNENHGGHAHEEEANHVEAVVLEPGEVVGGHPEVLGALPWIPANAMLLIFE